MPQAWIHHCYWNPQRPTLPFHCCDNALPRLTEKLGCNREMKEARVGEDWFSKERTVLLLHKEAPFRRAEPDSSPLVCWLPLLWTLIFNPAGFKAGEKATYHLKAIFPFSGILALENISSNISTFHVSRDLCNFFIAVCLMSSFISARKNKPEKKVLTHRKWGLIPHYFILPYKRRKGTKITNHAIGSLPFIKIWCAVWIIKNHCSLMSCFEKKQSLLTNRF